jgi:glucose-6-phosphate 1-dehydrogenase
MTVDQIPDNPLAEGLERERRAPPGVLIVFGASGDLTARKLMPALERLSRRGLLPPAFSVVGIARTEMTDDDFRKRMLDAVPDAGPAWVELVKHFRYVAGEYAHPDTFAALKSVLGELDASRGTAGNRTYYLATVPSVFEAVVSAIGEHGLNVPVDPHAAVRIVIEKPFGRDLASALQLDAAIHEVFDESQVYRIDH